MGIENVVNASEVSAAREIQKLRVAWVDYAKGIGIFLVVLGHVLRGLDQPGILDMKAPVAAFVDGWIYAFHMPLFFFVSGLFLADRVRRSAKDFLLGVFGGIVYPYFVWSICQTVMQVVLARYTNSSASLHDLWRITFEPVMQFWFLYALFLTMVIYFALAKAGFGPWLILSAFIVWAAAASRMPAIGWVPLLQAQHNGFYVALGAALNSAPKFQKMPGRWPTAVAAVVSFVGYGFVGLLVWRHVQAEPSTAPLPALCGIVATVALASLLGKWHGFAAINTWGRLSLEIFVAHTIASAGIRIVLARLLGIRDPAIHVLAGTIVGLYFPILFAMIANRLGVEFLFRLRLGTKVPRSMLATQGSENTDAPTVNRR